MFPYSVLSFWKELIFFFFFLGWFWQFSEGKGRTCLMLKHFLEIKVVRGHVSKNLWKGLVGKMSQHFSLCTSAILHLVWKGTERQHFSELPFLIPQSYSINLCTERYRGSKETVEGMLCRAVEEPVSLFCQHRVEHYWPATARTEKCPAVLFPLHRLVHSLVDWWQRQYLAVSLSTLRMRTVRKGILVASNVNSL